MAEPTKLTTRIISKHITLDQATHGTWKPYEGEIVLARVDTQKPDGHGGLTTVPTYLMKVGAHKLDDNGNKTDELYTIEELQWTHALASDVYSWAKQSKLAINDPDASDASKNVITNIVATETGITITRASVATSDALETANAAIEALQAALGEEVTNRTNADTALDNKITAINDNLNGTTEGGIGKRLEAVESVASGAASKADQNATNLTNYKAEVVETLKSKVDVSTYDAKMSELDTAIGTTLPNAITEAADGAKSAVIGASGDAKTADTIYGAKAYAEDVATTKANAAQSAAEATAASALATAKSELQGNINTLSSTVSANEAANNTAHATFTSDIAALKEKVANVSTVMDFVGVGTVTVTKDEETQEDVITVTVDGVTSFQKGDVVASNDGREFVYDGSKWHEFGYADDTEATVANLKADFESFKNTTVPNTYATKSALEAETTARTTAIKDLDTAYKAADASLKSELEGKISEANTDAYDRAVAKATELDTAQTAAITTAYEQAINTAKNDIQTAQTAIDAAQDAKITTLETAVGDENSGLVKGLADEIARADAAEKVNAAAIKVISDDYLKSVDKTELANATTTVANNLSTLSGTVSANKQDVDTNFVKVVDGKATVGGVVIIFDCGGVEEA